MRVENTSDGRVWHSSFFFLIRLLYAQQMRDLRPLVCLSMFVGLRFRSNSSFLLVDMQWLAEEVKRLCIANFNDHGMLATIGRFCVTFCKCSVAEHSTGRVYRLPCLRCLCLGVRFVFLL